MPAKETLAQFPDDPAALKAIIARLAREHEGERDRLQSERDRLQRERDEFQIKYLRVQQELLRLRKWRYGPRADRLKNAEDVAQLLLAFARAFEAPPAEAPAGGEEAPAPPGGPRRRRGRRDLAAFANLPVTRRVHELSEAERACPGCGVPREKIGEEASWQIEYLPARFERVEHVRAKYACRRCEAEGANPEMERAAKPPEAVEKGLPGPGLLAHIVTSKFHDYLPLYRLEAIFARHGFEIDRATQSAWCRRVAELARPVYDRMVAEVLASGLVATDDTTLPMQAPGRARPARMWVYLGDEAHPYNVFDFTLSRGRDGPARFLAGYNQTLLADGYGGYDGVVAGNQITRAGCWAHARRKFVEAEKAAPEIARDAVALIRGLYQVEERGRGLESGARLELRRRESSPILGRLRERLLAWKLELLPKHPMAEAVGYALRQWGELNAFLADGAVPLDNNAAEREMKRIVLNRKNSLFVGNERGGQTAAVLASLTSTCRRHSIDPEHYLTQLLVNLPAAPRDQLDAWLPDRWKRNLPPAPA